MNESSTHTPRRRARTKTGRLVRTGVSGLAATAIDVMALVAFVELADAPVALAAFLGAVMGAGCNFTLSKFWAFRCPEPIDPKQVFTYAMVSFVTACVMAGSVHFLAVNIGMPYLLAKGIAAAVVFLVWSYPAQAKLVFPSAPVLARQSATWRR